MSMIAERLGITKAALYKHYTGKQEILDRIVERMNELDRERAAQYQMPQAEAAQFAKAYLSAPAERILAYSTAQFNHWTQSPFRRFSQSDAGAVPGPGPCAALSEVSCSRTP